MLQGCYKDVKTEEVENFFVLQWKKIREVQKRMKENAFIKLPRSLLNSQYFDDPRLFDRDLSKGVSQSVHMIK